MSKENGRERAGEGEVLEREGMKEEEEESACVMKKNERAGRQGGGSISKHLALRTQVRMS